MSRIGWNEPRFDQEDIREVTKVLEDAYVNEGPETKQLEEELKKYLNVKNIILTTSATSALFLAIKADAIIRNLKDFEVIVPDMTMIATAMAVSWAGGKPILVDVDKEKMTLDIEKIKNKITPKTSAIIPVHILGRAPNMERLKELAQKHNLSIIEDAAGALGSKYKNNFLGTIGKVGCFSLQSNKIITCGQGGIIATNDDEYNEVIRRLRDFGRADKEFIHKIEGYNLKFNDLSASLALSQFRKIDKIKENLIQQKLKYETNLSDIEEIKIIKTDLFSGEIPLWVDVIVEDRDELISYLNSEQIFPRKCWPSLHRNPPYQFQGTDNDFPNSSFISDNCLWLPNGPAISLEQIDHICNKIKEFYNMKKFAELELQKINEDKRGAIYLVKDLLSYGKEFTFLQMRKGCARGGCLHKNQEFFVVIKGKIKFICGDQERIVEAGSSGEIPPNTSHAFVALEDSIVSEWGITTEEKQQDQKDPNLRRIVDQINEELKLK